MQSEPENLSLKIKATLTTTSFVANVALSGALSPHTHLCFPSTFLTHEQNAILKDEIL